MSCMLTVLRKKLQILEKIIDTVEENMPDLIKDNEKNERSAQDNFTNFLQSFDQRSKVALLRIIFKSSVNNNESSGLLSSFAQVSRRGRKTYMHECALFGHR